MRVLKLFMIIGLSLYTIKCSNVVVKNVKTHTVKVAKLDNLYEIGDTIFYEGQKSEIVRKKLKDGTVIKKGVIVTKDYSTKPNLKKP